MWCLLLDSCMDSETHSAISFLERAHTVETLTHTQIEFWHTVDTKLQQQVASLWDNPSDETADSRDLKTALVHLHLKCRRNYGWCEAVGCNASVWKGARLEWHHTEPDPKKRKLQVSQYKFSNTNRFYHTIQAEIDNCKLYCRAHHKSEHTHMRQGPYTHTHTHTHTKDTQKDTQKDTHVPGLPLDAGLPSVPRLPSRGAVVVRVRLGGSVR